MIVTVFRSRLRPENLDEYIITAGKMNELAQKMPGYISHKVFIAEDGERVTIVNFESKETHIAWAKHPEHIEAQQSGREKFYQEFNIQVCEVNYTNSFKIE